MRALLVTLALLLAAVAGCGGARVIRRTAAGGVLVLEGFRERARDAAHREMTAHCRGPYTIVGESDEAAGQVAAFRVHYVCGEIPGVPSSTYEPPAIRLEGIPDANDLSLD